MPTLTNEGSDNPDQALNTIMQSVQDQDNQVTIHKITAHEPLPMKNFLFPTDPGDVTNTPVACNFVNNSSALPMRPVCIIPMFF